MKNQKSNNPRKPRAHTGKRASHYNSALKLLRKRLNLTLAKLAELCGVGATKLSSIERGNSAQISVFEAIAAFFHVSLDALVRNDVGKVIASLPKDVKFPSESEGMIPVQRISVGEEQLALLFVQLFAQLFADLLCFFVTACPRAEAVIEFCKVFHAVFCPGSKKDRLLLSCFETRKHCAGESYTVFRADLI